MLTKDFLDVVANNNIELQASDSKGDRNFKASDRASVFLVKLLLFVNKLHFFIGSSGFFPILKHNQRPTSFVAPTLIALIRLQKVTHRIRIKTLLRWEISRPLLNIYSHGVKDRQCDRDSNSWRSY
ncbi:hypothetical protein [Chroococcidiopsis sp.]|uniref:hypothetical protein n=1 Tax=Chroococcidiopsis sp. TaxID=3088168 RepID=UPI003F3332D1